MEQLQIENVSYIYKSKYQSVKALDNISVSFKPSRFYALVGRSGSGKTTLLSLLAGLDLPTEGSICFDGTRLDQLDRDAYRRNDVAVIYQNYNLFPLMTVLENVAFPLEMKKIPQKKAASIAAEKLKAVGLDESYLKRVPAMLSGGEQQRVAIARALASQAKVLLADEPTGNLDTENSDMVFALLQRLAHEEGHCVIVVTHDMDIARKADEVIRLKDGKIVDNE